MSMQPFNSPYSGGSGLSFSQMILQNMLMSDDPEKVALLRAVKERFRSNRVKQLSKHKKGCDDCKASKPCDERNILKTWMRES